MYDKLAPHYRKYSLEKARYLDAVDKIIIGQTLNKADSMLDVGSGDGIRAIKLAKEMNINNLVLSEPSPVMVELCKNIFTGEVWAVTAENLPTTNSKFDVITCLWNVIGHIPNTNNRLMALKRMHDLLKSGGVVFIDVNNRYNARSYGWGEIMKRVVYDLIFPKNNKGDTIYKLKIDEQTITGMGHLFTPREINNLIKNAGFRIKKCYVLDYRTGVEHSSFFFWSIII